MRRYPTLHTFGSLRTAAETTRSSNDGLKWVPARPEGYRIAMELRAPGVGRVHGALRRIQMAARTMSVLAVAWAIVLAALILTAYDADESDAYARHEQFTAIALGILILLSTAVVMETYA